MARSAVSEISKRGSSVFNISESGMLAVTPSIGRSPSYRLVKNLSHAFAVISSGSVKLQ